MVIKIINLQDTLDTFDNIADIDLMPEIKEATYKVKTSAKDLSPVDTGALKGSVRSKLYPAQQSGVVYTTLEYAPHQEFGYTREVKKGDKIMVYGKWRTATKDFTVVYSGKPFMRPAMNMHRAGIVQSMKKYIRDEVKKKAL